MAKQLESSSIKDESVCEDSEFAESLQETFDPEFLISDIDGFYAFMRQAKDAKEPIFRIETPNRTREKLIRGSLLNYNRKEKSLEELSRRFLQHFLDKDDAVLELDKLTHKLQVERRRVYDVINILESLEVISKTAKNQYKWSGILRIENTIEKIQEKETYQNIPPNRKEKSLEFLSLGFLRLFLHWRPALALEEAAIKLSGDNDPKRLKTKIRRLYDIANVFKSLGLLQKVTLANRRPGFEWIGAKGLRAMLHQFLKSQSQQMEDDKHTSKTALTSTPNSNSSFRRLDSSIMGRYNACQSPSFYTPAYSYMPQHSLAYYYANPYQAQQMPNMPPTSFFFSTQIGDTHNPASPNRFSFTEQLNMFNPQASQNQNNLQMYMATLGSCMWKGSKTSLDGLTLTDMTNIYQNQFSTKYKSDTSLKDITNNNNSTPVKRSFQMIRPALAVEINQ